LLVWSLYLSIDHDMQIVFAERFYDLFQYLSVRGGVI
jgi:hypothetical protein